MSNNGGLDSFRYERTNLNTFADNFSLYYTRPWTSTQ